MQEGEMNIWSDKQGGHVVVHVQYVHYDLLPICSVGLNNDKRSIFYSFTEDCLLLWGKIMRNTRRDWSGAGVWTIVYKCISIELWISWASPHWKYLHASRYKSCLYLQIAGYRGQEARWCGLCLSERGRERGHTFSASWMCLQHPPRFSLFMLGTVACLLQWSYLTDFHLEDVAPVTYPQQFFKFQTWQMTVVYYKVDYLPGGVRIWFRTNCRVGVFGDMANLSNEIR